ncbi:T9SS type A sorting domain-containing protein [Dokdonia sp.]|uniref:T9SS type A sorting domain-containing protein n=1 Tax=Dokdonia sp. TaxID=2024995 RepID=UPI0032631AE8
MKKLYLLILCCLISVLSQATSLNSYLRLNRDSPSILKTEDKIFENKSSKEENKNIAADDCEAMELTVNCQDITIFLDENGTASITPPDVVTNFLPDTGYTIDQTGEFNPVSLNAQGTMVDISNDEVSEFIPIGFDFTFFGEVQNEFRISSKGFITFDDNPNPGVCYSSFSTPPIPTYGRINNFITPVWWNWTLGSQSRVKYHTVGMAPNRIVVVEFKGLLDLGYMAGSATTQIHLYEGSSLIEFHSLHISSPGDAYSQGIENADGTEGYAAPGRSAGYWSAYNDYVAFIPNTGGFPDEQGNEVLVSVDVDTFTCDDLGENTVIITATNSEGTMSTCTAIVTVIANPITLEIDNTFCAGQGIMIGLTGGLPVGGVYSGEGVTDDGNGETFSFDPNVSGEGMQDITYTRFDSCGIEREVSATIEIVSSIPDLQCQDVEITLDENGETTISPEQLFYGLDFEGVTPDTVFLYGLSAECRPTANIFRYFYNLTTGAISRDVYYVNSIGIHNQLALDQNIQTGVTYILSSNDSLDRDLYMINLDDTSSDPILIKTIVSSSGDRSPEDMIFDSEGNLYFLFENGVIETLNLSTLEMTPFMMVPTSGDTAIGLTLNTDTDRLIVAYGNNPVHLLEVNPNTGGTTTLFSLNSPVPVACGVEDIEYVGDNQLVVTSSSCDRSIYRVDLLTEMAEVILESSSSYFSVKDLHLTSSDPLPTDNCSGQPIDYVVTPNLFMCDDIGDNEVTFVATDVHGNIETCSFIITVLPFDEGVAFTPSETVFCTDSGVITGLGGGIPEGGIYSGLGVTDDGNGLTCTFDPVSAGVGNHAISYAYIGICDNEDVAIATFEVLPEIPELDECPDITIELDSSCELLLTPELLVSGGVNGKLYAMYSSTLYDPSHNIRRYDYNSFTDEISLDSPYSYLSELERNYALTQNPITNETFLLGGDESGIDLYTFDINNENSELTFVSNMVSVAGNEFPFSMEFDGQGNLYILYSGGEINILDLNDMTLSLLEVEVPVSDIGNITYDDDDDRFLFITTQSSDLRVFEFQIGTHVFNELFEYTLEEHHQCIGAKTLEYLGNNKIIVSSNRNNCNTIYTLDLNTQEIEVLLNPTSTYSGIKELYFIKGLPIDNCNGEPLTYEIDPPILTCDDVGENVVTITATDSFGNMSICTPTVTIVPFLGIQCTDITVLLDETGVASISIEDVLTEPIEGASLDISEFSCSDLGQVIVTASVEQGGETISCQATVTVIDNTDPVIEECFYYSIIVTADPEDNTYTLEDFTTSAIFSDNCDIDYLLQDPPVGTVFEANEGSYIDITAVDVSGNIGQECSFFLTVDDPIDEDDIEPGLFTGQYYVEQLTDGVYGTFTFAVDFDNSPFIFFETITDISQESPFNPLSINERSFDASYTPILFGIDPITFIIDFNEDTGNVTLDRGITLGFSGCGGEITLEPVIGGEFDPTDDSEFIVSILDNHSNACGAEPEVVLLKFTREAPFEAQCTDITVALDENGMASILPEDLLGEPIEGTSLDISEFSCSDIGEVIITVTLNQDGETANCEATVTVVDTMAPVISDLPSNSVVYAEEGETTYILEDFTDLITVSDNCTIDNMITQDPQPGAIFNIGDTVEVVVSATDTSGNVNVRSFILTIEEFLSVGDNILNTGISIYPNPTTDTFTIENRNEVALSEAILTDVRGRILKKILFKNASLETVVSMEEYANGLYFIQIQSDKGITTVKQIIKN